MDAQMAARGVMRNRIRSRIQEGLNRNLNEGRHYYALDQAWDTPFRQVTPTLLQSLMDKNLQPRGDGEDRCQLGTLSLDLAGERPKDRPEYRKIPPQPARVLQYFRSPLQSLCDHPMGQDCQ